MVKKKPATVGTIANSRARHDYDIKDTYVAGIVLSGAEVKSLRMGHGHLKGAFVNIKDGELWLFNATINAMRINQNVLTEEKQTVPRKLLVKKRQLNELISAKEQGLTIIPLKIFTKGRFIKIEIATARGLKKYDKREKLKKRDQLREAQRSIRH